MISNLRIFILYIVHVQSHQMLWKVALVELLKHMLNNINK